MTSAQAAAIEAERTPEAVEIETIGTALTIWFSQHKGCKSEIAQFKAAERWLDTIAGDDDDASAYLKLTLYRDWYRALHGHDWTNEGKE